MKKYILLITLSALTILVSGCSLKESEIKEENYKNSIHIELDKLKNCTHNSDLKDNHNYIVVFSSFFGKRIPFENNEKKYVDIGDGLELEACLDKDKILLQMTKKRITLE